MISDSRCSTVLFRLYLLARVFPPVECQTLLKRLPLSLFKSFSLIATSQCGVLGEQLSVRGVGEAGQAVQPAVRQDARLLWIPIF